MSCAASCATRVQSVPHLQLCHTSLCHGGAMHLGAVLTQPVGAHGSQCQWNPPTNQVMVFSWCSSGTLAYSEWLVVQTSTVEEGSSMLGAGCGLLAGFKNIRSTCPEVEPCLLGPQGEEGHAPLKSRPPR